MAITASNDFLRFSAYSIKDLITRKLSEDSSFTDQIYEGSNLAILIDIVSYMYQCLIYNLNNAAAESMFSDTQIYENISRLCKFIGYHPTAFIPSTINMFIQNNPELSSKFIYPCTAIDTGLYDSNSNKIYFSTTFQKVSNEINKYDPIQMNDDSYTNVTLVNGRWKHYSTVFTAAGLDYETFVLDGIKSDSASEQYVANNGIQVFVIPNGVDDLSSLSQESAIWYNDPNEIFIQAFDANSGNATFSKLYDNNDQVYTSYLNENKTFEIKFGNGITGKKLNRGDQVHVMYLDTNGPDGYVDTDQFPQNLAGNVLEHSASFFGINEDLYKLMFGINDPSSNVAQSSVNVEFSLESLSRAFPEQNPSQIREMAPNWFKTGNRLITKEDYEFFLKSNNAPQVFPGVIDAVCMNNWDYMTSLYRWLYNIGLNPVEEAFNSSLHSDEYTQRSRDPYRYLSKARLVQAGYQYVDSADANNIYIWIASTSRNDMDTIKHNLNTNINNIKTMTSEIYPLYPIDVYFDISFTPSQLYYDLLLQNEGSSSFDYTKSYLEVTISDNSIFSNTVIAGKVQAIIQDAFNAEHCRLGQVVDYSQILDAIYQINGVSRVRTVYYPEGYPNDQYFDQYKTRACDGISFASWSSTELIDVGDDLQINNTTRTLEKFQFPRLVPGIDLQKKIKVIRKSMNTTNPIKF